VNLEKGAVYARPRPTGSRRVRWVDRPRFAGIQRLYSPRAVAVQQGTIRSDYPVAADAADHFYHRRPRHRVSELLKEDGPALAGLIRKTESGLLSPA
jgi:isocitrate lyase